MAITFNIITYHEKISAKICFLAGDIGGTNSNFGIFAGTQLLISLHVKSQEVTDFAQLIQELCQLVQTKYSITLNHSILGVAGIITDDHKTTFPTNLSIMLDATRIKELSNLQSLELINDFEAVAWGLPLINPKNIVCINTGRIHEKKQKACIGAGTGLGKSALAWHDKEQQYKPLASEGGHADAVLYSTKEMALANFIQKMRKNNAPVSWEELLSGRGIKSIYHFLATQKTYPQTAITTEIAAQDFNPDRISHYARQDPRCQETFQWYMRLYARCTKNFALDTLALSGVYIAGGIAAKNLELFQDPGFLEEFTRCVRYKSILQDIPVFVITDYNISLYGAANYALCK